jgi:hypothetical protein
VSHPYSEFVREFDALLKRASDLPRGDFRAAPRRPPKSGSPLALVLAPHPDDECIVGALPLRLQRESGWRVAVAPVTLGSRVDRRDARLAELRGACGYLGWDVIVPGDGRLAELLRREKPDLVLFPHAEDANSTHRRVHALALDALRARGKNLSVFAAETEFWSTLTDPNLMVEASSTDAADLIAALSFHKGEIARNPYHVLLPCWLADGARRGAELCGGQGAAAPAVRFAALYRLSHWNGRALERAAGPARIVAGGADLGALFVQRNYRR